MIVEANPTHIAQVCRAQPRDALRFAADHAINPRAEMRRLMNMSAWRRAWIHDGKCLAVGGVIGTILSSDGIVWLSIAEDGFRLPVAIVKEARAALRGLLRTYRRLTAVIVADDAKSLRFAASLGFAPGVERTLSGVEVREFSIEMPVGETIH